MKKSTIKIAGFMMLAMLLGGHGTASAQNFDLNGDGAVDVADVSALISHMAGESQNADIQRAVNAARVQPNETPGTAINLGLPSGRRWADKNLGYSKDKRYGMYFAWGECKGIEAKEKPVVLKDACFDWTNYEWVYSGGTTWMDISKYTIEDGVTDTVSWYTKDEPRTFIGDNLRFLVDADDAAHAIWKSKWRMPYTYEFEELLEFTTQIWSFEVIEKDTIWGCKFFGLNPASDGRDHSKDYVFFPAAGSAENQYVEYRDGQYMFAKGKYWSKELDGHFAHDSSSATMLSISRKHCCEDEVDAMIYFYERRYGLSIRPVMGD